MHGAHVALQRVRRRRLVGVVNCVKRSREPIDEGVERLECAVNVFAHVHAARPDTRKHRIKGRYVLVRLVAAVVDQDVDRGTFRRKSAQKSRSA